MRIRKNLLAWIGIILAVIGLSVTLITPASKWLVLIPVVVLVASLVTLFKGVAFVGIKAVKWVLVAAWFLVVLFTAAVVLVAVFFGWLALLPFVLLCGAVTWLVYLLKKSVVWIPILALVIAIILFGVYCIMGSFMKDWTAAIDTLTVKTLIVDNADIENADIENENVNNQNVNNQKVENSEVNNQKVENQEVNNQKVENQEVNNQKTDDKKDEIDNPKKENDTNKEEAHKHSYTSKVVAATCTEKGYTLYTCACGHSYKDAYKDALGHKYTSKVVAPTTEAQGYTIHTCDRCGHSYKDNYTAKLEPEVKPAIKCAKTIRYGETLYVNLEGIKASKLLVSNKNFVSVEVISDNRVAITLTEDVDGYITITDSVSRVNVVIDIVSDDTTSNTSSSSKSITSKKNSSVSSTKNTSSSVISTNSKVTSSDESLKNESNNTSSTTTSQTTLVDEVESEIKCSSTIRYGETLFVNLKGINASDLYVGNPAFVAVEIISNSRVSVTLTEDVTGYIVIKDNVSGCSITVEIVE